ATGSYANTATISGNETDPTPGNNTSTSTPVPVPQANLGVTKVASNNTPAVGSNITFTITASNAGPSNATGVVINDVLPAGYTFVSSTPSVGTYNSGTGVWTIGNLANGANATLTITVTVNATGSYANTATISGNETDPTPGNNTSTSTPVPVNNAPVANDDAYTIAINTTLNNNASTNDVLITAGNPHTYTLVSGGTATVNGTLVLNTDGTFSYTPNTGFTGVVTFTYQVCNQVGQCDDATVSITILPPPVANNDTNTTALNTPVNGGVSGNDVLPAGGTYTFTVTTPPNPAQGTVTMNSDGTYTFTPATGFTGTATFTYQVCNQVGQCDDATVSITVLPPPVANDDTNTTALNTPVNGGVSGNDVLPAGGTYTFTVTTPPNPAQGTVTMNSDGTYTFTPATGFTGTATFTYQVCNQVGQCDDATVSITILPPPVANDDTNTTALNTPVNGGVSGNDILPAGGTYTFTVTTPPNPAQGTVTMNSDGTYTFTPATGFTGTATFTYQVCNQVGQCDDATVSITIPANPTAVDDSAVTPMNTPVNGNVGTNDNLPTGFTYTFSLVNGGTAASNGTLVLNPDGTYTYTPNTGFTGVVSFTYQVCNQVSVCSTAVVTITVLPAPTANNDTNGTALNTPVSGGVSGNDVLPAGGTYTFTVTTPPNPTQGTVVMNSDGTYTFTPATGFVGTATFTYQVCNQFGQCSTATVTITIGQPPVAVNDTYNTGSGVAVNGNVGTNDQNPSGGTTTFTLVSGGTATQNGTLVLNPDGTFTYTPNNGFVGTVTFVYQICNPTGCSQATVTINVAPLVVAVDDNYTIAVNNPITDSLSVNDILPAGSIPVFSLVSGGTAADNGTLVVNTNGTFTFTPNNGFVGTVTFTYQVCNQFGQCSTATVTITIIEPTVIIPEGFSPNNDGTNDFFIIKGRNGRPLVLKIYNRWGNLVYENNNYEDNWNGLSNVGIRIGEQLPDGTYFYTAEFKDNGERYARYLTIKR
ncbi:MAG: Ig-like domain-containing protein, partial [Raineya sp.]|nr:Ig-like domain-containing protein [Raineya sp.]